MVEEWRFMPMTIFWDWNGTLVDDVDTVVMINY